MNEENQIIQAWNKIAINNATPLKYFREGYLSRNNEIEILTSKLKKATSELSNAIEVIEFYASKNSYRVSQPQDDKIIRHHYHVRSYTKDFYQDFDENNPDGISFFAGKRAKDFLDNFLKKGKQQ